MRSTGARVGLLLVLIAVAVALFVVLKNDEDGDGGDGGDVVTNSGGSGVVVTSTTGGALPPPVVEMRNGAPVGGVQELEFAKGKQAQFYVKLDEPQEDLHIHGYDIEKLNPRGKVLFDFKAELDGVYELEAHGPDGDVLLAELRVNP